MALLLTDAQKLTNNQFVQGIIDTIVTESMVLQYLPFMELNGNSLIYNQEATLSGSNWYAPADTWAEQAVTVTQKTAVLKILGGDVDVDNFLNQTFRNPNELRAEAIAKKAKAIAYGFNDAFFNGTGASNQPTGLKNLVTGGQTRSLGTNGAAPVLDDFDALIDMVKPGKPDAILMLCTDGPRFPTT
jgi:HK97 family phage major capsid protein